MSNSYREGKVSLFNLEGRFIGFADETERYPKRLQVATATGDRVIKLSKYLRGSIREALQPGDWVQIYGEQKLKKTGELKLKALAVKSIAVAQPPSLSPPASVAPKPKACVMICQKSSCRKRGAAEVAQAVQDTLCDRGLEDQVAIKDTGCMKQCKQGPCMVFMPDKSRYTGVTPERVNILVDRHFTAKLKPEENRSKLTSVP
ncbi:MAG TPA: (2Fe-2S) ferredoxin domain-containing protein [Allocoleopsis sp.]